MILALPFAEALPPPYDQLLGPVGLTVAAVITVGVLGRELFKFIREYIKSLEEEIDKKDEQLKEALTGWQAQTAANQTLANAQEARNRDDELRHRLEDAARPPARGARRD